MLSASSEHLQYYEGTLSSSFYIHFILICWWSFLVAFLQMQTTFSLKGLSFQTCKDSPVSKCTSCTSVRIRVPISAPKKGSCAWLCTCLSTPQNSAAEIGTSLGLDGCQPSSSFTERHSFKRLRHRLSQASVFCAHIYITHHIYIYNIYIYILHTTSTYINTEKQTKVFIMKGHSIVVSWKVLFYSLNMMTLCLRAMLVTEI